MAASAIPDDVRRFILSHALTVPDVEALLALRAAGDAGCDAGFLVSRLYVPPPRVDAITAKLRELQIIEPSADGAAFVYRPASDELTRVLDALVTCYVRNLVQVTHLIHSAETRAAQRFADAFRIRKET